MAEFKISRLRYTWRGNWTTATAYLKDDVVRYGGSSYVCIRGHTASVFVTDQTFYANVGDTNPSPAWTKMTDGYAFRGNWAGSTLYNVGDILKYGGNLYLVITSYTSASVFDTHIANLAVYTAGVNWRGAWAGGVRYGINDLIRYGGNLYLCNTGHESENVANGLDHDIVYWTDYYLNVDYKGEYQPSTEYRKNELVTYNGSLLKCITSYVSQSTGFDAHKWTLTLDGNEFDQEWSAFVYYGVGSVVRYGGYLYYAVQPAVNKIPELSIYGNDVGSPYWKIISKGINFRGAWSASQQYRTGDVVRRGGILYVSTTDHLSDISTLDYLDDSNWDTLTESIEPRGDWTSGVTYSVGDIAAYKGSTYKCNTQHISSSENFPGDNGSGFFYWNTYVEAQAQTGMSLGGDLLTYGLIRDEVGDTSSFGLDRVPVGDDNQLLTVESDTQLFYKDHNQIARYFYVSLDGVDDSVDSTRGLNPDRPFRTVRYACEQADDGYSGFTTIHVETGEYVEIVPILVPARTVILGSELRSTTITASEPVAALVNDATYGIAVLTRLGQLVSPIVRGIPVTKTPGNASSQIFPAGVSTTEVGEQIIDLIEDFVDYVNFYVNSTGTAPTLTGTNTAATTEAIVNAVGQLSANLDFLAAEAVAFLSVNYPGYSFDSDQRAIEVKRYVNSWIYDITYTGNYKTILEARYYRNQILGCQTDDFFYLRDATGVRNCTLKGLEGTLNPPDVFNLYQRPTGGAYTSLDPGWGPNDSRTWITTRSPYVQGVTNLGTNCVGIKIDGSLHSGGNKSMVANDYTQVLSDGVGAWVTNNGRTELVSVFTYYCTIGYLAELGGIIRSANGNCSYGNYGAIADDVDPTETPLTATVNNRNQEAIVRSVLAGEFTDEIQVFEFTNAGTHYTTAEANIVGAGVNAEVVFEDFRDNAVFEARILDVLPRARFTGSISGTTLNVTAIISGTIGNGFAITGTGISANTQIISFGSGTGSTGTYNLNVSQSVASTTINAVTTNLVSEYVGGGGYSVQQNNAQPHSTPNGDLTSITIASNDPNFEADYLGKRIIITGGTGTGQYGYITAYNTTTKVVSVSRESDDQPGWDNVISGRPTANPLDTTTRYRIEPRVTFSAPPFSVTEHSLGLNADWSTVVFGGITSSWTNVPSDVGTGTSGITPITATFNVTATDLTYTVTVNNAGAGYAVGDVLIIEGDDVGGETPENDITITVTEVSDDSTNSILDFDYEGVAHSGRFVVLPSSSNTGKYSKDGETWTSFALPSSGNWKSATSGNNTFVAIRNGSNQAASSTNGSTWTLRVLPSSTSWNAVDYGNGVFLAVAGAGDSGAYSTTGTSWTSVTLPNVGDSSFNEWVDVAYGKKKFVVLANSNNYVANGEWDPITLSWTWDTHIMDVIADSSSKDWVSIAYGNNRWVAISSTGDIGYSFDGEFWYPGTMPSQDGSTPHNWKKISYGQGVFFAVGDTGSRDVGNDPTAGITTFAATSEDGVTWTSRTLVTEQAWTGVGFGNPYVYPGDSSQQPRTPMWIAVGAATDSINKIRTGCKAKGRVEVTSGVVRVLKLFDTGSGYIEPPTVTLTDPTNTSDADFECRIGDGVLTNPEWINRGIGYRTTSTTATISGNGYAEVIPVGKFVTLSNLVSYPGPGAQITFAGNNELYTVVTLTELGNIDGGLSAYVRISPNLKVRDKLDHDIAASIRIRYSQVRVTGHDFLDIGTGNFDQTNYPELYATGIYQPTPENEVYEENGGRVFYTSTDQSGNFRTGELFAVEQATGIVTISADFFDLAGLSELRLGGIRVGGTGAVIREFSTDPLFTADSNNVVPTQRAIKAYLNNRLTVGGSEIATSSFIAGLVRVGPDLINNTISTRVVIPQRADFDLAESGISGSMLAQSYFTRSFSD